MNKKKTVKIVFYERAWKYQFFPCSVVELKIPSTVGCGGKQIWGVHWCHMAKKMILRAHDWQGPHKFATKKRYWIIRSSLLISYFIQNMVINSLFVFTLFGQNVNMHTDHPSDRSTVLILSKRKSCFQKWKEKSEDSREKRKGDSMSHSFSWRKGGCSRWAVEKKVLAWCWTVK